MKKNILSALAICAALIGCQKNEISETRPSGVKIHATIEDDAFTNIVMDENNSIRWSEGDQIIAFMKSSYGHKYQVKSFIGETYAVFSKVSSSNRNDLFAGMYWDHIVAYYPYAESIKCAKSDNNYALNVILPSEQTYVAEGFGNGTMAMVAVSEDNNLTFKNVLGGIKIQLKGTQKVKSIKLEGKNNETLSGAAVVTAYTDPESKPAITMSDAASTSVTLNCDFGVQLNESAATEFIIALPPVLFSKGFTMTIIDDAGNEQTIETDKKNSVLRSSLLVMPEVTLDKVPHTGDYVDEYGINHGPGVKIGETVWAPVNCGYHAVDFKYGKLYQWGRKYGQGYNGTLYDVNGKSIGTHADSSVPTIEEGGVSAIIGQHKYKSNVFFTSTSEYNYDWLYPQDDKLWNSGLDSNPVKTENDPCPEGWRVPTYEELDELNDNYSSWTTDENGHPGYWFSGPSTYSEAVPQVFFPAAGYRGDGDHFVGGDAYNRGRHGTYWSSRQNGAHLLDFNSSNVNMSIAGRADGFSVRCVFYSVVLKEDVVEGENPDTEGMLVEAIGLNKTTLTLAPETSYTLTAYVVPTDATDKTLTWSSDGVAVARVDQNGVVTAVSDGSAVITVVASSGVSESCTVTVITPPISQATVDYVDEYGVNHGKGIAIGGTVWAPVNCGYKAATASDKGYPYGKLYQWGRKYGQGYDTSYDADEPTIEEGPVSLNYGQNEANANVYFTSSSDFRFDWLLTQDDKLWNSGTESSPVKTDYDPCPKGWRVPTYSELSILIKTKSSWTTGDGQKGYWFSGVYNVATDENAQVFFPAAGRREFFNGDAYFRGDSGAYWASLPNGCNASHLHFWGGGVYMDGDDRVHGYSVRCVQVTD